MRTLRNFFRSLTDLPRGFSADGRPIGIGLDAALKAQRARGIDDNVVATPARPVNAEDRPYTAV